MLPSETMIWQPEFTDKTLSRKPGAVHPPVETGAWKDAVDWVLKEACCAVILGKADNPLASSNQVGELTMWVKRLVSQLKKANPDCKLPEMAMDYLKRNGLISVEDVLR